MDEFLTALAADLKPVRRRSLQADGAAVIALCAAELAVFLALGMARPDLAAAVGQPILWWKWATLGTMAALGLATALRTFQPENSPKVGLWAMLAVLICGLTLGWALNAGAPQDSGLVERLNWREGVQCLAFVVGLSAPPAVLLAWQMARGAPTARAGTALAIGVGSATWAGFVFSFACRHDDPVYVVVWYGLSCALTALAVQLCLLRTVRW